MDKAQGIKEKVKKVFASPIYSTIVLVPLLIVVILVSAAVFMVVERTNSNWTYYDAVYYIITLVTTIGMYKSLVDLNDVLRISQLKLLHLYNVFKL